MSLRSITFRSEEEFDEHRERQAGSRENSGKVTASCHACGEEFQQSEYSGEVNCPPDAAFARAYEEFGLRFDVAFNRAVEAGTIRSHEFTVADVEKLRQELGIERAPVASERLQPVAEYSR